MKKILLLMFSLLASSYLIAQCDIGGVAINSILAFPNGSTESYDTDGDGTAEAQDEFVEICNNGASSVNISSWTLKDENGAGADFTFPLSTILNSGDCVLVVQNWNPGSPPSGVFSRGSNSGWLNNDGDNVYLSNGTNTCKVSYGSQSCGTPPAGTTCNDWGDPSPSEGCTLVSNGDGTARTECAYNPQPLPITLLSFTAKPHTPQSVQLDWITSSEENNAYFSIEHSTNGRTFESIDMVEGALNSVEMQYYNYVHKDAVSGNNYYRLRQVDTDGTFSFSPIEVVRLASDIQVEVRPTLAESVVAIAVADAFDYDVEVEVIDVFGRTVIAQTLGRGDVQVELSVSNLQKGHYFVRVHNGAESRVARFIKR
jgi:hypothetical protein